MREFDADTIHAWVAEHRVVVFRGLRPFEKVDMPAVARRLGPLLAWPFGAINELVPAPDAQNYLYQVKVFTKIQEVEFPFSFFLQQWYPHSYFLLIFPVLKFGGKNGLHNSWPLVGCEAEVVIRKR